MRNSIKAIIAIFAIIITIIAPSRATDLLDTFNGASIITVSSEYSDEWSARNLLDRKTPKGWCSAKGSPFPHIIVMELKQLSRLEDLTFSNSSAQEDSYPGISARKFQLFVSTTSPTDGFKLVLENEAGRESNRSFRVDPPAPARWIKLVILSNYGNPFYTEVMKLWAYGTPLQPEGAPLNLLDGAEVLSASSQHNDSWSAKLLLDKTIEKGWCSAAKSPFPHTIVLELRDIVKITKFVIDNRGAQESSYPGISARHFKLYATPLSKSYGYKLVLEGEAAQRARKEFSLDAPISARWLQLEILSNWGNSDYTEIMELEAYSE